MSKKIRRTCSAIKLDGSPCSVRIPEGSSRRYFHDEKKADVRRAAQALGGQGNLAPSPINAPELKAETVCDLGPFIVAVINLVLRGELSPKAATAIGNLVNSFIRVLDLCDLQMLHNAKLPELNGKKGLFVPDREEDE